MVTSFLERARTACAAAVLSVASLAVPAVAADVPKPESGTFKLGIEPWLGYGLWHVAAAKDIFTQKGLEKVEIVNFVQDKDVNAALAAGQLDGANIATHTAMGMAAAGLPIKIVLLLDVSMSADAILAGKDVKTIADLKGKQVAFEQGTTSDILLNYALQSNGMTIKDIEVVPMPAADAGSALIAGRVPVAVTYEPYLTVARKQDPNVKLLFTAGVQPGLVSDVLVIRDEVLKSKPGQVHAMLAAWEAALKEYQANTPASREIIAKAVGSNASELDTAFDGVKFYSVGENKAALTGEFTARTFDSVKDAATKAGILTSDVAAKDLIDPSFVTSAE